jgi:transcription antitermination factor NusG
MDTKEKGKAEEQWIVVKTNPRAEKKVDERLVQAGFLTYLPLLTTIKVWSDRKKKVTLPLIPSTLFVKTTPKMMTDVYAIHGVHSILKFLGKPAVVNDFEINNLKILLNQKTETDLEPIDRYKKGELVQVIRGPFEGLIANVMTASSNFRLVVAVESLGSGFVVNVPKSYVAKWTKKNS